MAGAYNSSKTGKAAAASGASSFEVAELKAMLEQTQRQLRTLARETGHLAQVEYAGESHKQLAEVDPKKFGNTEGLKHGLTSFYIEKPFRELEEEMKEEGGELRLPDSIYTVAICAGFFADGNVWDQIEHQAQKAAAMLDKVPGVGDKAADEEGPTSPRNTSGVHEEWSTVQIFFGFVKNVWFMFVNAFVLLIFHYFLTFCVLYFLMAHPYDTDTGEPYNNTGFADAWDSHFNQGECPSSTFARPHGSVPLPCCLFATEPRRPVLLRHMDSDSLRLALRVLRVFRYGQQR